jgi:hypothetical protein
MSWTRPYPRIAIIIIIIIIIIIVVATAAAVATAVVVPTGTASASSADVTIKPGLRGRRQLRRPVRQRLHRTLQPQWLVSAGVHLECAVRLGHGSSWSKTALTGSIAAGAHYLIKESSGGSNGLALPTRSCGR